MTTLTLTGVPLPEWRRSTVVVDAPDAKPGAWAGAPSAVVDDGVVWLAYRLRRPIGEGRGFRNVIARSTDGLTFETVAAVGKDVFGGESLERPALVRAPSGAWRLYVSIATPGSKHWRVDLLEADTPAGLATATPTTVLPGDETVGVKDPVLLHDGAIWHLWASCHPLESAEHADRMTTRYATSEDGVRWTWRGTALAGTPGAWDARGARVTSVTLVGDQLVATYDGRATAEQNWEESTGVATAERDADGFFGELRPVDQAPISSPYGGLRYVSIVPDTVNGGGATGHRLYFEATRPDGAHELRCQVVD
jgi:hypothetical protein